MSGFPGIKPSQRESRAASESGGRSPHISPSQLGIATRMPAACLISSRASRVRERERRRLPTYALPRWLGQMLAKRLPLALALPRPLGEMRGERADVAIGRRVADRRRGSLRSSAPSRRHRRSPLLPVGSRGRSRDGRHSQTVGRSDLGGYLGAAHAIRVRRACTTRFKTPPVRSKAPETRSARLAYRPQSAFRSKTPRGPLPRPAADGREAGRVAAGGQRQRCVGASTITI